MTQQPVQSFAEQFATAYGGPPAVRVRAPGRVNLIGEHTDYSNLPVLPFAIDRALTIAAAPADDGIVEVHSAAFDPPARIARDGDGATAPWHAYVAGALREITDVAPGRGARVLIDGDLPAAAGLSSSSALSVGLIAALGHAWGAPLEPADVAARAAAGERHTGAETGGMDQLVIALAEAGAALRIDFDPPSHRAVPIPAGIALVVASSGEAAAKSGEVREAYNERVIGARLGAAMLLEQLGLDVPPEPRLRDAWGADAVPVLVDELPPAFSVREVARSVGIDPTILARLTAGTFDNTKRVPVRKVVRHILDEADRVDAAEQALRDGDGSVLGALLNASHDSLRGNMACSTKALDRLCAAMRKAGAWGARLTGAGFGGYAIAVLPPERVDAVVAAASEATGSPAYEVHAVRGLELL